MARIRTAAAVLCAAMLAATGAAAAEAAGPTLEDYGRLPSVSEVEISPDGAKVAMLVGDAGHLQLQIRETAGYQTGDYKTVLVAPLGAVKVRALQWAGPHHLLVISSVTSEVTGLEGPKREWMTGTDLNLDTRKTSHLLEYAEGALNSIASTPVILELKGKPVVFVQGIYFPGQEGVLGLYRIDLENGHTERVEDGNPHTDDYVIGLDGRAVARVDYNARSGRWALSVRDKRDWKEVHSEIAPIDHPEVLGLGHDGSSVLVRKQEEDGGWSVHEVAFKDGSWSPALKAFGGKSVLKDPLSRLPIAAVQDDMERSNYDFLSPQDQATWRAVLKAFPKEQVELASWSQDRRQIIVKVEGDVDGAGYFMVDLSKGRAGWLADEYRGVGPEAIAEKRVLTYKAADGFEIPAYLTVPKDRPAKALPLVVLVHGGPEARDDPGFDWWAQALASRGYAVLQPQYRGSSGFSEEHLEAGYGEWGRKMQTDLSDGVRFLAKSGEIDPKRVCIMGASYGGYAALAGATLDPSAYRCAVSVSGPADLRRMLSWVDDRSDGYDRTTIKYWDRFMGAKSRSDRVLDDISPALHADKAAMPVLLIHGQDDTVVPYEQSKIMEQALKRAGKPVEFVTLKSEDHWLSRSETRLQMLTAAVKFLEANNPPDPAPATAATAATH